MNLPDRKMHFLGNYNHDFPRLAKQSGFFFQLHRGKVNWSEIECLDLDDITENRNFELLERNLLNVINCNLEREYDLKILDQNFIKLFRLAQLGIDYLSYCEMYLDRCVVLLQEQCMSIQEGLKNENEDINSDVKKTKNRKKSNYQCDKCDKVFISDVYLKFHDKRRHSNQSTPKIEESCVKKVTDASQQTELEGKLSASTQTSSTDTGTGFHKPEEVRKAETGHYKKIKRLEKNLNNLKGRLQKTEKALQETRKATFNSAPVHYHPLVQFIPTCLPPSRSVDDTVAEHQKPLPKSRFPVSDLVLDGHPAVFEGEKLPASDHDSLKEYSGGKAVKSSNPTKIDVINNKENINPQDGIVATKPLPPPRKTKKKVPTGSNAEENNTTETSCQLSRGVHSAAGIFPFSHQLTDYTSVKGTPEPNTNSEKVQEINTSVFEVVDARKTNSNESLSRVGEKPEEVKSFFRKVVGRTSPKLQRLGVNLKRPLTTLRDSVSLTGIEFIKMENKFQKRKSVFVDGLNGQLRELGVDPEWKGIPKRTLKQKLKDLTHRRTMLSEGNPLYSSVRQTAEEKIFEKLKKKFSMGKTSGAERRGEEPEEIRAGEEPKNEGNGTDPILYDTDTDSWARRSDSGKTQRKLFVCATPKQQTASDGDSDAEEAAASPTTVQGNRREEIWGKNLRLNDVVDEALTNSDFEDDLSICPPDGFFKTRTHSQLTLK